MLDAMPDYMRGTSISANACGLAALGHLRVGDEDRARSLAEEALDAIKNSTSNPLASIWGFCSSIEVLLRVLAHSTSKLDLETAKAVGLQLTGPSRRQAA